MEKRKCKILITGSDGFLGKNLCNYLNGLGYTNIYKFDRNTPDAKLEEYLTNCDFIFHLAGINRPNDVDEFYSGNCDLTQKICEILIKKRNHAIIIFASSSQALLENDYGKSKKMAEDTIFLYSQITGIPIYIFRFPGIYGKWCRPNYNSVVATFCNNIANDLPITIDDPDRQIDLIYVDDVCDLFGDILDHNYPIVQDGFCQIPPTDKISLGELAQTIKKFHDFRSEMFLPDITTDLKKKLYSTYLSYLPKNKLSVSPEIHSDDRGSFGEIFKTQNTGQISVSVTNPGITRGNHYHKTKTEKFIALSGRGSVRMRDINDDKLIEVEIDSNHLSIVDIPPGFTHSIVNTGDDLLVTLIWANELFNSDAPDTFYKEV